MTTRLRRWAGEHRALAAAWAAGLLVLLVLLYRFAFRAEPTRAAPERTASVAAETARTGDMPVYLDGIGTVTPRAMVTVHPRVDGHLMAVHFVEGQAVADGDLLAEIDPRPFQVALEQAEGQLARDQALLANAKVDVLRYRALAKDDAIPKQQLDTQEALVRQYEAALVVDRGQIDAAKLDLTYSRVTAPVGGRIGLRLVDPGNLVHATDTGGLAVVTKVKPIDVVFTLPEDELPALVTKVRAGARLVVDALDREGKTKLASGMLLTIDNTIDPTTGTVRVKAEFPNDDETLFPNQFVNARLELDVRRGVTIVPEAAVQRGTQGTFVWIVKDDQTVEMRPVTLGVTEGPDASLDKGVAAGERVVIEGAEGLRPGAKVTIQTRKPNVAKPHEGAS
jgi:membrane fusion protein, multidrug efflux system